jgi:molybdopterin/thiamine biosynthesis adenylyltransferase
VTYDEETKVHTELNINDAKVKDRWSRYIGALGIDAVAKQAQSRILICGMGALGIEIAKNITLAGCKELILYDSLKSTRADLSGQFFLTEKDVI